MRYKAKRNNTYFDTNDIIAWTKNNDRIKLIKKFKDLSGYGLKESKYKIEKHKNSIGYNVEGLIEEFKEHLEIEEPLTKEEFMNIIESAIDEMNKFHFTDMLDAVLTLCKNIEKNGGLKKISKDNHNFLNNI